MFLFVFLVIVYMLSIVYKICSIESFPVEYHSHIFTVSGHFTTPCIYRCLLKTYRYVYY